ncbi:MAG TPA: hypothetical protein PLO37_19895 [Candidatus Hydrogenedentes bacterium]|nr:hypothetical protein [Candidatus Hydrogenedentota bacterium]HPG69118.1 hypothetical protein [Candidatus Hydrogenedentota bacterium]
MAKSFELGREELRQVQLRAILLLALLILLVAAVAVAGVVLLRSPDAAQSSLGQSEADVSSVLVVPGSTVYHREDCPALTGQRRARISLKAALTYQYQPCPECKPPVDMEDIGLKTDLDIAPGEGMR